MKKLNLYHVATSASRSAVPPPLRKWNCFPEAASICVRNALIYRKCICWMGKDSIPGLPWMSHGLQRPARLSFVFHFTFTQKTNPTARRQPRFALVLCPTTIPNIQLPTPCSELPLLSSDSAPYLSRNICFPGGLSADAW